jgi:hypothetical protein
MLDASCTESCCILVQQVQVLGPLPIQRVRQSPGNVIRHRGVEYFGLCHASARAICCFLESSQPRGVRGSHWALWWVFSWLHITILVLIWITSLQMILMSCNQCTYHGKTINCNKTKQQYSPIGELNSFFLNYFSWLFSEIFYLISCGHCLGYQFCSCLFSYLVSWILLLILVLKYLGMKFSVLKVRLFCTQAT